MLYFLYTLRIYGKNNLAKNNTIYRIYSSYIVFYLFPFYGENTFN